MHGRLREKRKKIFILLFLISILISLLYLAQNYLLNQVKAYLREEISRRLSLSLDIGKFEKWWGKELVFEDVSITDKNNNFLILAKRINFSVPFYSLLIKKELKRIEAKIEGLSISVEGFILPLEVSFLNVVLDNGYLEIKDLNGFLLKKIPFKLEGIFGRLTDEIPKVDLYFSFLKLPFKNSLIPEKILLSGDKEKIYLEGFINGEEPFNCLKGEILFLAKKINLVYFPIFQGKVFSPVKIEGNFKESDKFIKIIFDHFSFQENELISNLNIKTKYNREDKTLEGEIYSSGTLFNYLPFPEFEGSYKFKENILTIEKLKWTESFNLRGEINFSEKISGNLSMDIKNFDFFYLAHLYYPDWRIWGSVSGKIDMELKENRIFTKGRIELSEGEIGPFKFKGGRINFVGEDNVLKLTDSRIYQENGYFDLNGEVDFKKLGKPDFGNNLILIPYQERIDWMGWSISKKDFLSPISLDRDIDEKLSIHFRSYIEEQKDLSKNKERNGEFDLEYKLKEDRSLKLRLKDSEEILGFERKIRF